MGKFIYTGDKKREISFPLGGIGSGCIGINMELSNFQQKLR